MTSLPLDNQLVLELLVAVMVATLEITMMING
jgi:hypothetical protein